jgi:hypothetical protein
MAAVKIGVAASGAEGPAAAPLAVLQAQQELARSLGIVVKPFVPGAVNDDKASKAASAASSSSFSSPSAAKPHAGGHSSSHTPLGVGLVLAAALLLLGLFVHLFLETKGVEEAKLRAHYQGMNL